MAHTTNTISAPVRLEQDVWPVVGISGGLGYVISNATVSDANGNIKINRWAKFKPVQSNRVTALGAAGMLSAHYGFDTSGAYAGGGANIQVFNALKAIYENDAYADKRNGWNYTQVSGKYRLLDFNGYAIQANKPILKYTTTSGRTIYYDVDHAKVSVGIIPAFRSPALRGENLTLQELGDIAEGEVTEMFLGVVGIHTDDYGNVSWIYQTNNIGNKIIVGDLDYSGCSVNCQIYKSDSSWKTAMFSRKGEWQFFPFITDLPGNGYSWNTSGLQTLGKVYSIPYASPFTCRIQQQNGGGSGDAMRTTFTATMNEEQTKIECRGNVANGGSTTVTLSIALYYCDISYGSPAGRYLQSTERYFEILNNGTIAPNGSVSLNRDITQATVGGSAIWNKCVMWLYVSNLEQNQYTKYSIIRIQPES